MKKAILIIENDTGKVAEQLLDAFESRQTEGTEIIIAKTQQAADAVLASNKDIYAVISTDASGNSKISVLEDTSISNAIIKDSDAASCEEDFDNAPAPIRSGSFSEILSALEELDLLKTPSSQVCENHKESLALLSELRLQLEIIRERVQHMRQEIDNCPAKKRFFEKPAEDGSDKKSSGLSVAFLTFAGVSLTAAFSLLGKLFEVIFSYLKSSGGN